MKRFSKYLFAVMTVLALVTATACGRNNGDNVNDTTGQESSSDRETQNKETSGMDDISQGINDIGNGVSDAVDDIGDGLMDETNDVHSEMDTTNGDGAGPGSDTEAGTDEGTQRRVR